MKKRIKIILFSLLSVVFITGMLGRSASAESKLSDSTTKPSIESIENVASQTNALEVIDADQLPEGTQFINFDTIEEFEDFLKELEKEQNNKKRASVIELDSVSQADNIISPLASTKKKSTTKVLKVLVKPSWNPLKSLVQAVTVTVDLTYKYTGSGSKAKFDSITKVSSYSFGVPTDWKQTSYSKSFTKSKKAVNVTLNGYHLLGISVGGQPIGAKVSDIIKFQYTIGGKTNLVAK